MQHPIQSSKRFLALAFIILLLVQLACQAVQPAETEPTQITEATVEIEQQPTAVRDEPTQPAQETPIPTVPPQNTAVPSDAGAGMACFGTISLGISCLGPAGWQSFDQDNSSLSSNSILDITTCPDGRVAAIGSQGVATFDGANWKEYSADLNAVIGAEGIACDSNNTFWVAFMSGVSHWDGKGWTTYPPETVASGGTATFFKDIAVATDGSIWAISDATVSKFDGNAWTAYYEGQGFNERFYISSLALDSKGQPWIGHSSGLLHFDGENWQSYSNPDTATINALAIDSQDRVWAASNIDGLYLFEGGGWTQYDLSKEAGVSNSARSVAVDARDRVWITTEYGLAVFDGASWTVFHMHTADLVENDLHNLALVSGGPDLPAPMEKTPGILNARVLDASGLPIANAPVEICVLTLGPMYYGETPCSDQPFIIKGQTDADGNFSIADLPAGYYIITIYANGGWSQLVGQFGSFSERVLIRAGQTTNIGDITLQE